MDGTCVAGNGYEHKVVAWPDVKVVGGYPELGLHAGRGDVLWLYLELAPQRVDVLLLIVHAGVLHHMVSHGRMSTVGADHQVKCNLLLARLLRWPAAALHLEPGLGPSEIRPHQLVVEEKGDVWHFLEHVKQAFVEAAAINGEDGLARSMLPVTNG